MAALDLFGQDADLHEWTGNVQLRLSVGVAPTRAGFDRTILFAALHASRGE
jgi:hypothetical protein